MDNMADKLKYYASQNVKLSLEDKANKRGKNSIAKDVIAVWQTRIPNLITNSSKI